MNSSQPLPALQPAPQPDPTRTARAVVVGLLLGIAIAAGVFASGALNPEPLPTLAVVGEWSLTDHRGAQFGSNELRGNVWVGNFIFTRCLASCPAITAAMKDVESKIDDDKDVKFVSFTVDPAFDTPPIVAKYRTDRARASERWTFVTGAPDAVHALLRDKMFAHIGDKVIRGDPQDALIDIAHLQKLALFDRTGALRATASIDDAGRAELARQIDALLAE